MATSHGVEMQCAQECSKAACGAFYVQVKNSHTVATSLRRHTASVLIELIIPLPKADGLTCSLVPEDSSEGYKDVANLASADFNYFYKL